MRKITTTINFYFSTQNIKPYSEVDIIELNNNNIDLYKIVDIVYPKEIIKKRFHSNYQLYALLDKEIPVSFAWVKRSKKHFIGELNKTIFFESNMNCIIDCITLQKARSKGYYSTLIAYLSNINNQIPTFIYTHNTNIPSQKGIIKAGFKKQFVITKFIFWYFIKENKDVEFRIDK